MLNIFSFLFPTFYSKWHMLYLFFLSWTWKWWNNLDLQSIKFLPRPYLFLFFVVNKKVIFKLDGVFLGSLERNATEYFQYLVFSLLKRNSSSSLLLRFSICFIYLDFYDKNKTREDIMRQYLKQNNEMTSLYCLSVRLDCPDIYFKCTRNWVLSCNR